ncbi:ATP/GTP-binding protein [Streptomyces telluris]|uniref:ATP/GTP-binding protein n=1 Tax=Streptomyces telluris TaxID=2720021 RepID=A0A9X2RNK3_9ACTN|nr:ATP/GTP-binding protein [Streptomyces telluris]MCQ8772094.1 ATP/GTP-binding protein [Streptomyces telluris]NJP81495.1 ATP/GTP-binding protein [Streptomyces telluris]
MGRDLRALFSSNDRFDASEAFTNRQRQWELVTAALQEHLRHIANPAFDAEDLEIPRNNLLVFHGVGGIGKTTLSRKLEMALTSAEHRPAQWGAPTWAGERILPVRIDLSRAAGTDVERIVLTIRLALAGAVGRPLPAFDLALRRYWEHNHPGEPLEEYVRRSGLRGKFAELLPRQMQAAVGEVVGALELPGMVGSAVGQVTGALVRALRERRQTVRALAGCARLADLLEAEPDLDALSYYPHLLSWELARLPVKKRVVPVILFDTFEDIGDRTRRDFERLLQRVVWLMPGAFFVISGRSRLQWADEGLQGQLDFTGPAAWPGLATREAPPAHTAPATGGSRQILVGDFSPEDCDDYLARRLSRDGQPLIGEDIRAVITARSHGLPLHLDLAISRFLEIRRTGRTPTAPDFDHAFPALIARTLSDLTAEERHVLRSVALLDAFDLTLATRTAGLTHQVGAQRLTERPFVDENPYAVWLFHLHGAIRTTIRTADDNTDDRWTESDWHQAAERALAALGEQWTHALAPSRTLLVSCLRQGLRLARDHHLGLGWLTEAAWAYVGDSVWEPLAPPAPDEPATDQGQTAADTLVELLSTLARRQHEHRERTTDRLAAVIDTGLLPNDLSEMATYYLAKACRDLGRSDDSRRGMQRVADSGGRLAPAARRGLAHLARMAGDFPLARETARTLGWEGRHHRVMGDIWWPHGNINQAVAAYTAARSEAEQHGVAGEQATTQAHLALVTAFADPTRADDELLLAQQLLNGLDLRATTLTTQIAALIRDAGTDDIEDRAHILRTEIDVAGLTAALQATLELALAFHHAVRGSHQALASVTSRLRELTRGGDYAYYADIAAFIGDLPAETSSPVRWVDGEAATRDRWRALVIARRAETR